MKAPADPTLEGILATVAASGASALAILDLVLGRMDDGVGLIDAAGTCYLNAAARRLLGLPPGTEPVVPGADGSEVCYLHDFAPVAVTDWPLARALRGEDSNDVQLLVRSARLPEGAVVRLDARPIRDAAGAVVGGVAVYHDEGARMRAEEQLRTANTKLAAWVAELERRATVTLLMNEMADLLQSCRTMKEFHSIIALFAGRIFERQPGAVFVVNSSRSALEMIASWGDGAPVEQLFAADACWALRRGRLHRVGGGVVGPPCDHVSAAAASGYACVPMMAQGEALGVVHVRTHAPDREDEAELGVAVAESRLRALITVAEHIALALANLKLRESLQTQAVRDPLTGLFNRRHMEESLDRELARACRAGGQVAAVMIDLDHFKRYNDTFGHAAADLALRETAKSIRSVLRTEDIACRFGGEELVVILPDATVEQAARCAEAIRVAVSSQQLHYRGTPLGTITASFGVAGFPVHSGGAEGLLRAADEALYQAKREGRDRVCVKGPPEPLAALAAPRVSLLPGPGARATARY